MLSSSTLLHAMRQAATRNSLRCFSATASKAGGHMSVSETAVGREYTHPRIGDREIVGWGINGSESYIDRPDFPYPAIRWKSPNAPGVPELRQKELGDWKALSMDEKKALYRASFCQTFPEFLNHRKGEWKLWFGTAIGFLSLALWLWFFCKLYVYKPLPSSFSEEGKLATLRYEIAIRKDPVTGIASRWDYEKDQWK